MSSFQDPEACSPAEASRLIDREETVNRVLLRANLRGFEVDTAYAKQYLTHAAARIEELVPGLMELGWVTVPKKNIDETDPWRKYSPVRSAITQTLLDEGLINAATWPRTTGGQLSTAKGHLSALNDPRVTAVIEFMELQKNAKDYVQKALESMHADGRVRPETSVLGAATGRMSYREPPVQQFNDPARRAIRAHDWGSIDWTAVEPVTAAALAGQWDYVAKIEAGADPYIPIGRETGLIPDTIPDFPPVGLPKEETEIYDCAKNHKGRKQAKVILLGLMYGEGIKSLSASLGMEPTEARTLQDKVFATIPRVVGYLNSRKDFAGAHGYVFSASGRVLTTTKDKGAWRGYLGQNYTCQGSAYDVLAEAIYEAEQRGLGNHIHLAMHDELIVDAAVQREFEEIMQSAMHALVRVSPEAARHRFCTDANALETCWKKL